MDYNIDSATQMLNAIPNFVNEFTNRTYIESWITSLKITSQSPLEIYKK